LTRAELAVTRHGSRWRALGCDALNAKETKHITSVEIDLWVDRAYVLRGDPSYLGTPRWRFAPIHAERFACLDGWALAENRRTASPV
jgi:hypothetical protein